MNAKETLKRVKKERQRVKEVLKESHRRCQEMLWALQEESPFGQERMDSDEVKKITIELRCAEKVLE